MSAHPMHIEAETDDATDFSRGGPVGEVETVRDAPVTPTRDPRHEPEAAEPEPAAGDTRPEDIKLQEAWGQRQYYKARAARLDRQLAEASQALHGFQQLREQVEKLTSFQEQERSERERLAAAAGVPDPETDPLGNFTHRIVSEVEARLDERLKPVAERTAALDSWRQQQLEERQRLAEYQQAQQTVGWLQGQIGETQRHPEVFQDLTGYLQQQLNAKLAAGADPGQAQIEVMTGLAEWAVTASQAGMGLSDAWARARNIQIQQPAAGNQPAASSAPGGPAAPAPRRAPADVEAHHRARREAPSDLPRGRSGGPTTGDALSTLVAGYVDGSVDTEKAAKLKQQVMQQKKIGFQEVNELLQKRLVEARRSMGR